MFGIGFCLAYLGPPCWQQSRSGASSEDGAAWYYVGAYLLIMMSLPIKMVLRWLFNLKYIVHIR